MARIAISIVWALAAWVAVPMPWAVACAGALAVVAGLGAALARTRRLRPGHVMMLGAAGAVAASAATLLEGGAAARDVWLAVLFGAGALTAFLPRREGRAGPAWAELMLAGAAMAVGATAPGGASAVPALLLAIPAASAAALAAETGRAPIRAVAAMTAGCLGVAAFLYVIHPIPAQVAAWLRGGEDAVVPGRGLAADRGGWRIGGPEVGPDLADLDILGFVRIEGDPVAGGLYLRSRAYHYFLGGTQWDIDPTREALPSRADGWTVLGPGLGRRTRRLEGYVDWLDPSSEYLFPGDPVRVSHPGLYRLPDGEVFPDPEEVVSQYHFVSDWVDPSDPGLDTVSALGPGETLEYPPGLEALKAYIEQVTSAGSTPAERARRLCEHVARTFEYAVEPAESYLDILGRRRGYCGTVAGFCVLALRSQGISARLAVGARTDEIAGGWYLVRRRHMHAWVEAYFGEYGWVAFDPTPPLAAVEAPLPPLPVIAGGEPSDGGDPGVIGRPQEWPAWLSFAVLGAAVLGGAAAWLLRRRGEQVRGFVRRWRGVVTPAAFLDRFFAAAARRGLRLRRGETPMQMAVRAPQDWRAAAREIVAIYYEIRFGARPYDEARRARVSSLMKAL